MALVKRKARRKLYKQLRKLVRKHGAEMTLALATGIVSSLTTDDDVARPPRKRRPVIVRKPAAARLR